MRRFFDYTRVAELYQTMRNSIGHVERGPLLGQSQTSPPYLLSERLHRVGLDPHFVAAAQPGTLLKLSEKCRECAQTDKCAVDLALNNANAGMEDYCPNADIIDELIVERSRG